MRQVCGHCPKILHAIARVGTLHRGFPAVASLLSPAGWTCGPAFKRVWTPMLASRADPASPLPALVRSSSRAILRPEPALFRREHIGGRTTVCHAQVSDDGRPRAGLLTEEGLGERRRVLMADDPPAVIGSLRRAGCCPGDGTCWLKFDGLVGSPVRRCCG